MAARRRKAANPKLEGLQRYVISEEIGRGGMGIVYRAKDVVENRDVALKELLLGTDVSEERRADALERFKREAQTAAGLDDPHVVRTYTTFTDGDRNFLVMEYVEGATLDTLIASGPLEPAVAVAVAEQVLAALAVAHAKGVVHRDLKPDNIFLKPDGSAKVGDFGVAQIESADAKLTRAGQVLGTVGYMPPEQVRGGEVDGRSDIFALGVIMYEMLVGANPFHADQPTTTMYKISYEDPPALDPFVPSMPAYLTPILVKAMAKDPDLRYQSAEEMLADLTTQTAPDLSAIEAASKARQAEHAKATSAAAAAAKAASKKPFSFRSSAGVFVAASLALIVVAAAVAGMAYSNDQRRKEQAAQHAGVVAEAKWATGRIAELQADRAELDSVVAVLKTKANASVLASQRWDRQWSSAQDDYQRRYDAVDTFNSLELQKQSASTAQPYVDFWTGQLVTPLPTYMARHKDYPSPARKPAKLHVNLAPELARLQALLSNLDTLQAKVHAYSRMYLPTVDDRLTSAIASLRGIASQTQSIASGLVSSDSDKGQVITSSSAAQLVPPAAGDVAKSASDELALDLNRYGVLPSEVGTAGAAVDAAK